MRFADLGSLSTQVRDEKFSRSTATVRDSGGGPEETVEEDEEEEVSQSSKGLGVKASDVSSGMNVSRLSRRVGSSVGSKSVLADMLRLGFVVASSVAVKESRES